MIEKQERKKNAVGCMFKNKIDGKCMGGGGTKNEGEESCRMVSRLRRTPTYVLVLYSDDVCTPTWE